MQPIRMLTLTLLASLLLVVPAIAGDHEGHEGMDHEHGADCPCGMDGHGDMGPDMHHGNMGPGMGHGGMMDGHGKMMGRKHRRMGNMGLSAEDRALLSKYPRREDDADYSWHPNRLRASAIEFLATDVYRMAILPFNDLSRLAPVSHSVNPVWAERMLRDTLAGSLLETGILVLPAENVEAAIIELKGYNDIRTSQWAYSQQEMDPYGPIFRETADDFPMSDLARYRAELLVKQDRERANPMREAYGLGALGIDYTPEEIRMIADALDVDGIIIGSISSWGVSKNDGLFDWISRSSGELVVNIYVLDGATGEPIWGAREEVHRASDWFKNSRGKSMTEGLAKEFSGSLLQELSHPVPMWYVEHLRDAYGLGHGGHDYHHRGGNRRGDGDGVPVSEDANLQQWKRYTHHIDSDDRMSRQERAETEVREERQSRH